MGPFERGTYRLLRIDPRRGQEWKAYAKSTLVFSALFWLLLYLILRAQGVLPFNPQDFKSGPYDLSFNTTSSFITNTNWQYYGGETTLSYFSQMAGLAVQNFVSAGVGMAVAVALIRAIASRSGKELGNFYADLTRSILYVLVPVSIVVGLVLVSQGVLQNLSGYLDLHTLTGGDQTLGLGPVASQEAIKELGTNGGGFFNVNSTMPFENPTWISNFVEMLSIFAVSAGADRDLRADGRQPPPGLGDLRRDDVPLPRRGHRRLRRRGARHARDAGRRDRRLQHGGQGAALRDPRRARSGSP